jgi:hypothetical protein
MRYPNYICAGQGPSRFRYSMKTQAPPHLFSLQLLTDLRTVFQQISVPGDSKTLNFHAKVTKP